MGTVGDVGERSPAAILRRRPRWLVPFALVLTVALVVALVEAFHYSDQMARPGMIQTAGFRAPTSTTPVPFSLPVLQQSASGPRRSTQTVTMSSLRGRPVVLNLWGSWCTVCKTETPAIESVAERAGGSVEFVGVDTLDHTTAALAFLHRYDVTYLQLFDPSETVATGYRIPGLPVTVFVSARGKVLGEYLGALNVMTLAHYLERLFGVQVSAAMPMG